MGEEEKKYLRKVVLGKFIHVTEDMPDGADVAADEGLLDGLDLDAADVLGGEDALEAQSEAGFLDGADGEDGRVGAGAEGYDCEVAAAGPGEGGEAFGEGVLGDEAEDVAEVCGRGGG